MSSRRKTDHIPQQQGDNPVLSLPILLKSGDPTLSLNSPLKANWFSGFPSGTLYLLNQSTVASKYPGFSLLTSLISTQGEKGF